MSEKVQRPDTGEWVTRNHPHEILSPHVMRFEEIRYWLKELSQNKAYGWKPGGKAGLCRALGINTPASLDEKLVWRWIWPREQVRLSARIREILDGYIVPTRGTGVRRSRVDGVYTDPPRPPAVKPPRVISIRATPGGGIAFLPPGHKPRPRMPSFSRAFAEAVPWFPKGSE